ncbi:recombinase family protein [Streptomyces sp. NBC_00435]|uniref:recombinase family protein n=1 Tax=Streptomyces sp. NBC_00435 TaxID=2903649 RepID=UPI002E1E36E1
MARALLAARISDDKNDSNSIEAQLEDQRAWALAGGHTVAGEVEDRTVSGDVNMYDRPKLGKWLTDDKRTEWDTLVVSTQDRLSRDDLHFMAFIKDVLDWGKTLIVLDDPAFDITTEIGRLIAYAKATQAAGELRKIKERVTKSRAYLRRHARWAGGTPPYGYKKVKNVPRAENSQCETCGIWLEANPNGKGYHLEPDSVSALVAQEAVSRMLNGDSLSNICRDFTERGILSPWDYARTKMVTPKEPTGAAWDVSGLRRILTSVALIGHTTHATERDVNGKALKVEIVRGEDGMPLQVAIAIIAVGDFRRLQILLEAKASSPGMSRSKYTSYMLRQVGFCGYHVAANAGDLDFMMLMMEVSLAAATSSGQSESGDVFKFPVYGQASTKNGKTTGYYRCKKYMGCPDGKNHRADTLEPAFEAAFLAEVGDLPHIHRVFIPGEDHSEELAAVERSIVDLEEDRYEHGLYQNEDGKKRYRRMMGKLEAKKERLQALPSRKAETRDEPSGMNLRTYWETLDYADRGHWLRSIEMRALVIRQADGSPVVVLAIPPGFKERALKWAATREVIAH